MNAKSIFVLLGVAAATAFAEPAPDPMAAYGNGPYMRSARDYDAQSPLDWPAAETREVAFARARTVIAKWEAIYAADRLNEQIDRLKRRFEASPEFVAAKQLEEEAWATFQQSAASVTSKLLNDPQYRANTALAAELGTRIDDLAYDQGAPSTVTPVVSPAMYDLASAKLDYARRASAIRSEALAADPGVTEAKAQLAAASARLSQLRTSFALTLKDDASVLSLRESQRQAKIAHMAAAAYEDTARVVRREAVIFAYYLHRSDSYPYYGSPYYGSGYGGGYIRPYDINYAAARPANGNGDNQYGFRRR